MTEAEEAKASQPDQTGQNETGVAEELLLSLTLRDIINIAPIQKLMDDFFALTGFGSAIVDNYGKVLIATGWQEICTRFHRVHPESRQHCVSSDTELCSGTVAGKYIMYKCKNNMWDIATPIMIADQKIGNLFLGQFFLEDETPPYSVFKLQAKQYGFDEDTYLATLEKVPRWNRVVLERVMAFYMSLASLISDLSYKNFILEKMIKEHDRNY